MLRRFERISVEGIQFVYSHKGAGLWLEPGTLHVYSTEQRLVPFV